MYFKPVDYTSIQINIACCMMDALPILADIIMLPIYTNSIFQLDDYPLKSRDNIAPPRSPYINGLWSVMYIYNTIYVH